MKFEDIKPNANSRDEIQFEGTSLFRIDEAAKCWHCGELTYWIDISLEAYLCSEECDRAKWNELGEALTLINKDNENLLP